MCCRRFEHRQQVGHNAMKRNIPSGCGHGEVTVLFLLSGLAYDIDLRVMLLPIRTNSIPGWTIANNFQNKLGATPCHVTSVSP